MCLAIPGMVKSISGIDSFKSGIVSFGGVEREINFSCLPDINIGDYVIAHAGVALQKVDEEEALKTIEELKTISANS